MTIIELKKRCDFKYCDKTRGVTSLSIFEQQPKYKSWGTLHICPEHKIKVETLIRNMIKPSVSERFKEER